MRRSVAPGGCTAAALQTEAEVREILRIGLGNWGSWGDPMGGPVLEEERKPRELKLGLPNAWAFFSFKCMTRRLRERRFSHLVSVGDTLSKSPWKWWTNFP